MRTFEIKKGTIINTIRGTELHAYDTDGTKVWFREYEIDNDQGNCSIISESITILYNDEIANILHDYLGQNYKVIIDFE